MLSTLNNDKIVRCCLIAEIGLAHEGSLGLAMSMASAAIQSGADVVKFQAHFPEYESSSSEKFRTNFSVQDETRWDYWHRTAFSVREWALLKNYVEKKGAKFSVSVFSSYSIDVMHTLEVEMLKIGSADLNNEEILEKLQDFSGTILFSTGMATWREIEKTANWLVKSKASNHSAILQCTSIYPTTLDKVGLNIMGEIKEKFNIPTGLSDHSQGINSSITAIVKGANYIEKHVVLSPFMFGPDLSASITIQDFSLLRIFRDDFLSISNIVDKDKIAEQLSETRCLFGRSLALKHSKNAGEKVLQEDFCLRKPSGGLSWSDKDRLAGKFLAKSYKITDILEESHFDS